MKTPLLSFLFFSFCFIECLSIEHMEPKKQLDSTLYYSDVVEIPSSENDLDKAYRYFLEYHDNAIREKDTLKIIYGLERLATIERNVGLYNESEASSVEGLTLIDQLESSPYLEILAASLHNNLGILYRSMELNAKSKELYQSSLELVKTPLDSMIVLLNLGNIFLDENNYSKSNEYLEKAYSKFDRVDDLSEKARVLTSLGYVKHKQLYTNGLEFMLDGLQLRKQIEDLTGLYSSYKYLSFYYRDLDKQEIQKQYLDSAWVIAKKLNTPSFIEDALKSLSKINGDKQVLDFININDSLKKANIQKESRFTLIKYDFDKLNQKVLENELFMQKERNRSIRLGFFTLLLILLSIGLILWLQARNRKRRLLDIYATESRISKKVHDEVANDVYHVMAKIQHGAKHNEEILDDLEIIYSKTREISKDNSVVFNEDFETTLKDLLMSFHNKEVNVILKGLSSINWEAFKEIEKTSIYKVLQELMVNMRKHSQASLVGLTFEQKGAKLHIFYSDNGQGAIIKKQLGLQNMENRIHAIGGTITFNTQPNKGFKSKIIL